MLDEDYSDEESPQETPNPPPAKSSRPFPPPSPPRDSDHPHVHKDHHRNYDRTYDRDYDREHNRGYERGFRQRGGYGRRRQGGRGQYRGYGRDGEQRGHHEEAPRKSRIATMIGCFQRLSVELLEKAEEPVTLTLVRAPTLSKKEIADFFNISESDFESESQPRGRYILTVSRIEVAKKMFNTTARNSVALHII